MANRNQGETQQLPEHLAHVATSPSDTQHAHVDVPVRAEVDLAEHVSTFERREGARMIAASFVAGRIVQRLDESEAARGVGGDHL